MPKQFYCEHCKKLVSKTLFYQHKRLYYDRVSKTWSSTRVFSPLCGKTFKFDYGSSAEEERDKAQG